MRKTVNQYNYEVNSTTIVKGFFKIYQGNKGHIILAMDNCYTILSIKQIEDLKIDVYDFEDFDYDLFKLVYNIK